MVFSKQKKLICAKSDSQATYGGSGQMGRCSQAELEQESACGELDQRRIGT